MSELEPKAHRQLAADLAAFDNRVAAVAGHLHQLATERDALEGRRAELGEDAPTAPIVDEATATALRNGVAALLDEGES